MRLKELTMDWRAAIAVVVSTLALVIDRYETWFDNELLTKTLLYLVIPLLVVLLVFRRSPRRYGLGLGDWRAGLVLTVVSCVGMAAVVLLIGRTEPFADYYSDAADSDCLPFWLADGIEMFGWEFLFRGFLLFALYEACGPLALIIQAVPFTMAHFGKPELETLSCIFGGTAFGYVAWRTRSTLYPFLIHWFQLSLIAMVSGGMVG